MWSNSILGNGASMFETIVERHAHCLTHKPGGTIGKGDHSGQPLMDPFCDGCLWMVIVCLLRAGGGGDAVDLLGGGKAILQNHRGEHVQSEGFAKRNIKASWARRGGHCIPTNTGYPGPELFWMRPVDRRQHCRKFAQKVICPWGRFWGMGQGVP